MDLVEEQHRLEARMSSLGVERFYSQALKSREDGQATMSLTVKTILDASLLPFADAIDEFIEQASSGKAGRRHTAIKRFAGLDTGEIAFIATKVILDGIYREKPLTVLAGQIGRKIEMEQRVRAFAEKDAAQFKETTKFLDRQTGHQGHRERVYGAMLRFGDGDGWKNWTDRDCVLIGIKLTEMLVTSTGLIAITTERKGKKTVSVVTATERFKAWITQMDKQVALLSPYMLPTVIPPKPWVSITGGGYHTNAMGRPLDLVKTKSKAHRKALAEANLENVLEAVNAVQDTPWQVNAKVLEIAVFVRESGYDIAGFLPGEPLELPPKPEDIATNEEARSVWKGKAAKVHTYNRAMASTKLGVLKTVAIAEDFERYDRIYFPHQLDFRGRVYAVPQILNPQGTDLAKGLLRFADGDPVDTPARRSWFLIHGANCFGVDKVSFGDRRAWVEKHHEDILRTAADPQSDQWWATADSPWSFLAWALEYAAFVAHPETFTSHLPIALDGSCNGLQHYSAMLRDPVGGAATNLVPSDKPQDIYGEVATVVIRVLNGIAGGTIKVNRVEVSDEVWEQVQRDDKLARSWLAYGITRKITKRPVMVLPYGGTQSSCQKYVYEIAAEDPKEFSDTELFMASVWLGNHVWGAIGEVVIAARLAMAWLRDVASAVSAEGHSLQWTTPAGFPVVQAYPELGTKRIETTLFGSRFDPRLTEPVPNSLDRRRQVNGVAPNFVHSLDASALILTVVAAKRQGVTKFAMIHDSYGTTAAHTTTLGETLREVFVRMYEENDMLLNFARDVVPEHMRSTILMPPTVGGLDLNLIRESDYFFA